MIILKNKEQLDIMDDANRMVRNILSAARKYAGAGMSSLELDAMMEAEVNKLAGTKAAFKGYYDYPNVSCISVNAVVVHGVPSKTIIFQDGDLVSIDLGLHYKGMVGDAAITFFVGEPAELEKKLSDDTCSALHKGIEAMVIGNRLHDISSAINSIAAKNGYGVVRGFTGHGIGAKMHENPSVFNYVEPREANVRLTAGIVLALEPMFVLGDPAVEILDDNWTVRTKDKSIAAHWELSVAITESGPRILGV